MTALARRGNGPLSTHFIPWRHATPADGFIHITFHSTDSSFFFHPKSVELGVCGNFTQSPATPRGQPGIPHLPGVGWEHLVWVVYFLSLSFLCKQWFAWPYYLVSLPSSCVTKTYSRKCTSPYFYKTCRIQWAHGTRADALHCPQPTHVPSKLGCERLTSVFATGILFWVASTYRNDLPVLISWWFMDSFDEDSFQTWHNLLPRSIRVSTTSCVELTKAFLVNISHSCEESVSVSNFRSWSTYKILCAVGWEATICCEHMKKSYAHSIIS